MKKKKLISLMLAGVMTAGITTMTGCDTNTYYSEENLDDVYITLEQDGQKKLHKGDCDFPIEVFFDGLESTGFVKYTLDCGKKYLTNADCYIYEEEPEKDDYDIKCEDCFSSVEN